MEALALLPTTPSALPCSDVYLGYYTLNQSQTIADSGKGFAVILYYPEWGQPLLNPAFIGNHTPMVSLRLDDGSGNSLLQAIGNGSENAQLDSYAAQCKAYGKPIFFRPGYEMNGNWMPYSGNATLFVRAWQYMYDRFRQDGVTNVAWVWAPNYDANNNWIPYYPGNAYCQYVGIDLYNFAPNGILFSQASASFIKYFEDEKPIYITETGSADNASVNKTAFIDDLFTTIESNPDIVGVNWFNLNDTVNSCFQGLAFESSSGSLAAWDNGIASPRFLTNVCTETNV